MPDLSTHPASLPVVVIGAGPVGLAAAANLATRGDPFVVLEGGPAVGHAIRQWGHVRVFSPWRYCVDPISRALLEATGWTSPDEDGLPDGDALVDDYLAPLAAHPSIAPHLRLNARVQSVARQGIDKVRTAGREAHPFEVRLEDGQTILARTVIDASGTWFQPNPAGANGRPAGNEYELLDRVTYGIPDVLAEQRDRYAGKRVLVVGSGHSAINSMLGLLELARETPDTSIAWAMRRVNVASVYGGEGADALPERGALGRRARAAVESGALTMLAPFLTDSITPAGTRVLVRGTLAGAPHAEEFDQVIVATGFRPDLEMHRELRLATDPILEASSALAPLIDPNMHSCGTVPPHGARELLQPEPNFFVVGMKSYGRAPTFLMATGFEQARSVVAHLVGDYEAAARVELILPETGVCGTASDVGGACCGTSEPAGAAPSQLISVFNLVDSAVPVASACCGAADESCEVPVGASSATAAKSE
ncbi:MAG: NAD(P)-binding domain-containing protein [Chloroflexi bacterium]|nr:NAD(P)-binding domain-containing protein [Chloroflexota bacterium]